MIFPRFRRFRRLAIFAWLALAAALMAGAAPAEEGILFLHLRLKDGVVTLVESSVRPGVLKKPRDGIARGNLSFQMVTGDGIVLEEGAAEDPSTRRLEYEDPDHPGQMKVKIIQAPDVEFTVRLAYRTTGRKVRFHRRPVAAPGSVAKAQVMTFIGEIDLPANGGKTP